MPVSDFEAVIGLEVHAQLLTRTKIFCGCRAAFGAPPNTDVCPVCLGLPGALPALNRAAVTLAVKAGKALGCRVRARSVFARKNYFYPDLPKGYQISQYELPLCEGGAVPVPQADGTVRRVPLTRIHLEEDAGKNVHGAGQSEIDLNRAGTPLIEIVGEPALRSAEEASEYLKSLRLILIYLGVNDGNLEEGSFRCDANVSVRPRGQEKLGTRVELKNLNSFRFIRQAIEAEIARQVALVEAGQAVRQETRLFDHDTGETRAMRSKEEANDYRYFPDPDLPPLVLDDAWVAAVPVPRMLPHEAVAALESSGVPAADARTIAQDVRLVELYLATFALTGDARFAANAITSELLRAQNEGTLELTKFGAPELAELHALQARGAISSTAARTVLAELVRTGRKPQELVDALGLAQLSDAGALTAVVEQVLARNPAEVERHRSGKKNLLSFFVGQAMKELKGRGNPAELSRLFGERLK